MRKNKLGSKTSQLCMSSRSIKPSSPAMTASARSTIGLKNIKKSERVHPRLSRAGLLCGVHPCAWLVAIHTALSDRQALAFATIPAGLHPIDCTLGPAYLYPMNPLILRPAAIAGLTLCAMVLPFLSGCTSGPEHRHARVRSPSVHVQTEVIVADDYVYYPAHEVYYSRNRQRYVYRDGRNWVTRSAPPRVAIDVLFASPSVRVDFHDSPARHHAKVIKTYPRSWRPAGDKHDNRSDGRNDNRNNGRKGDNDDDKRSRN